MKRFSDPVTALVVAHQDELLHEAEEQYLIQLARCNQPSTQEKMKRYINNILRHRGDKSRHEQN